MDLNRYTYYRDLVLVLVSKEFKVRYRSTFLGYIWSALHPLAFAGVFFVLFKVVVRIQMDNYALFLLAGLFPWQWFQNSVTAANSCFLSNASLIKKVTFPRFLLVVAAVLSDLIHFVITIPILVLFMLGHGQHPTWLWLAGIPLLVAGQFLFIYGMSILVATCNLFLRDLERLTGIFVMLWFYVTPVVFAPSMVPQGYHWLLYFNPMAAFLICWRGVFLQGSLPLDMLAAALGYGALACLLGHRVYTSLQWRLAEVV